MLTLCAANSKVKYILHAIHHNVPISVQKKEYQYAKSRGKVRDSVVHERKRTMHGILSTFLHHTLILLLPLKLRKNINL